MPHFLHFGPCKFAVLACLLGLLGPTPGFAQGYGGTDGMQEGFDPWWINCAEDLSCRVDTYMSLSEERQMQFILERSGAPDAPVTVIFAPIPEPATGGKVRLKVPDQDYSMFGTIKHVPDSGEIRFPGITLDDELIQALIKGTAMTASVQYSGPDDMDHTYDQRLDGITEALLMMDNHQGRIGRKDAMIAVGGRNPDQGINRLRTIRIEPLEGDDGEEYANQEDGGFQQDSSSVESGGFEQGGLEQASVDGGNSSSGGDWLSTVYPPDRGTIPILSSAAVPARFLDDAVLRALPDQNVDCRVGDLPGDIIRHTINEFTQVYEIPCQIAAYNGSTVFVVASDIDGTVYANLMDFPLPIEKGGQWEFEVSNPVVDTNNSIVRSFHLGRGIGDCGTYAAYRMVYGDGESLLWDLLEYREKEDCDGVDTAPNRYPIVFSIMPN